MPTGRDDITSSLEFRGHRVEYLARSYKYEEISFLLIWSRIPSAEEMNSFRGEIALASRDVPQSVVNVISSFPYTRSIPQLLLYACADYDHRTTTPFMPMIMSALSAWVGSEPAAIPAISGAGLYIGNMPAVDRAIVRTLAAFSVVVSLVHCHRSDHSYTPADLDGGYLSNLLRMMGICGPSRRGLSSEDIALIDQLWIIGADHELTNSTAALLHAASSLADPISCVISAVASSYGPLHFGAAESTYRLMQRIETPQNVGQAIVQVKLGKQRLMGIGHRVWKTKDPRCELVKRLLKQLKERGREDPLMAVAEEIERQVSADPYFQQRRLCVNVDLYWIFLYTAL